MLLFYYGVFLINSHCILLSTADTPDAKKSASLGEDSGKEPATSLGKVSGEERDSTVSSLRGRGSPVEDGTDDPLGNNVKSGRGLLTGVVATSNSMGNFATDVTGGNGGSKAVTPEGKENDGGGDRAVDNTKAGGKSTDEAGAGGKKKTADGTKAGGKSTDGAKAGGGEEIFRRKCSKGSPG